MMFIAGLLVFMAAHAALMVRPLSDGLGAALGVGGRKGVVALVSAAGLVLVVLGWAEAGALGVLYGPPAWARHVALALMLPALILLAAAYLPTGHIARAAKHPMLAGVKIWALAHLIANGETRSVLLFGGFLAYAVAARIAAKRRGDMGAGAAPARVWCDALALAAGALAYGAIAYWLHPILFGVAVVS